MNYLSVKELRLGMPRILRRLQRGEQFRLVYRARPVGDLLPLQGVKKRHGGIYALLSRPFGEIHVKRGESAAAMIRAERD